MSIFEFILIFLVGILIQFILGIILLHVWRYFFVRTWEEKKDFEFWYPVLFIGKISPKP